jgi:hypothetical protein
MSMGDGYYWSDLAYPFFFQDEVKLWALVQRMTDKDKSIDRWLRLAFFLFLPIILVDK